MESYRAAKPTEETLLSALEKRFAFYAIIGDVPKASQAMILLLNAVCCLKEFAQDAILIAALNELEAPTAPDVHLYAGERQTALYQTLVVAYNSAWKRYHEIKQKVGLGIETRGDEVDVVLVESPPPASE